MPSALPYAAEAPTREAIDAIPGATLLEFGTDWCGYCRAAEPGYRPRWPGIPG